MNKFYLLALAIFSCQFVTAQIGIGNTAPKAQLDISASNPLMPTAEDGILIPRINSFPAINPTSAQNGMLVFLATASGLNLPGFYYWSQPNIAWIGISNNNKSWDISGNSVAVSGINFIGTTNAQDVDFRSNNVIKMRLSQKGQVEILNTGKSVFVGEQAGENDDLTTNSNVFVGFKSGFTNVTGFSNVAVGYQSLFGNTTGSNNAALGSNSLQNNTTGNNNTGSGNNSLSANTTGSSNTAVGANALLFNTVAGANTAVGANSLIANTTGDSNTALGFSSLHDNTTGYSNIALGGSTLLSNTTGYYNTAAGFTALQSNTVGFNNTATGTMALYNNLTGAHNTAVGVSALLSNISGYNNTATGILSLRNNTIGSGNTAYGKGSLQSNNAGIYNSGHGMYALSENLTGNYNTAAGYCALFYNASGLNNVGIGANALLLNTVGNNNTGIGNAVNVALPTLNNTTVIGNMATVNLSNKVRLGNAAVTLVEGQVSFSNPSDARFKNNVKQDVPGLDFILKLKPVTYFFDTKKFDAHLMQNLPDSIRRRNFENQDYTKSSSIVHTGFLAQDIEKAANEVGYNFDGLHIPDANNPTDNYSVAYSQFIMPIVKSIQEQQQVIDDQMAELEKLKSENTSLKASVDSQNRILHAIEARMSALESRN